MNKKAKENGPEQSARFIEAAKATGADETGKTFERAFKAVVKPGPRPKPKAK